MPRQSAVAASTTSQTVASNSWPVGADRADGGRQLGQGIGTEGRRCEEQDGVPGAMDELAQRRQARSGGDAAARWGQRRPRRSASRRRTRPSRRRRRSRGGARPPTRSRRSAWSRRSRSTASVSSCMCSTRCRTGDHLGDRSTLGVVAVEQRRSSMAARDERQLPRQVLASCRPVFMPWPCDGEQRWAASPATRTHPFRNRPAIIVWQWKRVGRSDVDEGDVGLVPGEDIAAVARGRRRASWVAGRPASAAGQRREDHGDRSSR